MKSMKFALLALAICFGSVKYAHAQYSGGVMVSDEGVGADVMATRASIIDNGTAAHTDSLAEKATLVGTPALVGTAPVGTLQSTAVDACDSAMAAGGAIVMASAAPALAACQAALASGEMGVETTNDGTLDGDQAAAVAARDAAAARVGSAATEYEATEAASAATMAANDAQLVANNEQAEASRRDRVKKALQTAGKVAVLVMLADMIVQ